MDKMLGTNLQQNALDARASKFLEKAQLAPMSAQGTTSTTRSLIARSLIPSGLALHGNIPAAAITAAVQSPKAWKSVFGVRNFLENNSANMAPAIWNLMKQQNQGNENEPRK